MTIQRTTTTTWRDGDLIVQRNADGRYTVQTGVHDFTDAGGDRSDLTRLRDLLTAVLAEAEAPASTPAPWKPRVGDVVKRRFGSRRHGFSFIDADWCVESERSPVGVVTLLGEGGCIRVVRPDGVGVGGFQYHFDAAAEVEYVRRATAEERKAAGLPKEDEHAS